jgi:tagatose-6-phosphate ketose/aldose isomerase
MENEPLGAALGALLDVPLEERRLLGWSDTLQEILQQPATWRATAAQLATRRDELAAAVAAAGIAPGQGTVILVGSGSSHHVGECLAPGLRAALGVPVQAVPAGDLLTHPGRCLPPAGPVLVVSFARSGDSPDSRGVLDALVRRQTRCHHLIITCNRDGYLARAHSDDRRITRVVLDPRTNDRSLVMTSSFTNMVVAGRALGRLDDLEGYAAAASRAAAAALALVLTHGDALAEVGRRGFHGAIHLGTGPHFGGAREASLKMLEMSAGRRWSFAESFLGLRHGPMSAVAEGTLVVAYLSADPLARAYELDLLEELRRKQPRAFVVVVADGTTDVPPGEGLLLSCPGRDALGDDDAVVLDVVVGQLLGFFQCLALGLRPDAPSPDGTITRVVDSFTLHETP